LAQPGDHGVLTRIKPYRIFKFVERNRSCGTHIMVESEHVEEMCAK